MNLPKLNLPQADLKFKTEEDQTKVFDPLRGKYVALTPEEYVRQNFVSWLRNQLHYPASIMANEVGIKVNGLSRRCDTVIFNPDGTPLMIVEYKAADVNVTQNVFDQIVRYNMSLKAKYLVVSNGMRHYCCVIDYVNDTYHFIPNIPDYQSLRNPWSEN